MTVPYVNLMHVGRIHLLLLCINPRLFVHILVLPCLLSCSAPALFSSSHTRQKTCNISLSDSGLYHIPARSPLSTIIIPCKRHHLLY